MTWPTSPRRRPSWLANTGAAAATIASGALVVIMVAVVVGNDTLTLTAARIFTGAFFVAAAVVGLRALANLIRRVRR